MEIINRLIIRFKECSAEMIICGSDFDFDISKIDERRTGNEVQYEVKW